MVGSIQGPTAAPEENPSAGLEELHGVISNIDRDLVKMCTQLNAKIKALKRLQSSGLWYRCANGSLLIHSYQQQLR